VGIDVGAGEPAQSPLTEPRTRRRTDQAGAGTAGQAGADTAGNTSRRPASGWRSPVTWLVAVIPGVLGLITGGYRVSVPPIWGDEGVTKAMTARSVSEILATMPHDDVVHGAYYLVVHVVEEVAGSSTAAVLRLPSVIAMAVAASFTALIARRLAALAGSPYPGVTGLIAGAVFTLLPGMISYAQEARSYAIVTMLAAVATYVLIKAACDGGRWWAGYGAAAAVCGLFNLFGLLILAAHGVSILIAGRGLPGLSGRRMAGVPVRWVFAGAGAVVVLIPVVAVAYTQRGALAWMTSPPDIRAAAVSLARSWAGSPDLVWPVFGLAAFGVAAGAVAYRRRRPPLTPGSVALPWLVVPPTVLLVVSQVHPVYDGRYVEYCLPALAILVAWGLEWAARVVAVPPLRRAGLAWLGWLPPAVVMVLLVVALIPADAKVRLPNSRPDNLAADSQIVAANAKPGDIVFFIPMSYRPITAEFPAQWRGIRDIALAESPVASDTLYGIDVSPAELLRRFTHVTRVWVYSSPSNASYLRSARATPVDKEEAWLVSRMQRVRQWRDGDKMLTLYQVRR
jgi:mannosyltransferase